MNIRWRNPTLQILQSWFIKTENSKTKIYSRQNRLSGKIHEIHVIASPNNAILSTTPI